MVRRRCQYIAAFNGSARPFPGVHHFPLGRTGRQLSIVGHTIGDRLEGKPNMGQWRIASSIVGSVGLVLMCAFRVSAQTEDGGYRTFQPEGSGPIRRPSLFPDAAAFPGPTSMFDLPRSFAAKATSWISPTTSAAVA
jgi:hypothetical protein